MLSPKIAVKVRVFTPTMSIQHHIGNPKQGNKARKINIMHKIGKEEIKLVLFAYK